MTQIIFGLLLLLLGMGAWIGFAKLRNSIVARLAEQKKKKDNDSYDRDHGRNDGPSPTQCSVFSKIGIGVAMLGLLLLFTSGFVIVDAGYRGVVVLFGNVDEKNCLREGFHWVNPFSSVVKMSARVEKDEEAHQAETSDTQSVTIKVITNWRPSGDVMASLYKNYGMEYATKIIPPAVRESVKAEVAKYKVTELINKRPEIHHNVQANINTWLNKYGLEVLEIAIGDIDFSDNYDKAIEAKQVQEQQALQKQYELQKTKTEAEMAAAKAKGEADSKIAEATGAAESVKLAAQAEADALKIRGEAQADFNRKVSESLSPLLIQAEYLKRWDGKLPVYTLGSGSSTMLMLPTDHNGK
jgi:regulator of protease activity HflC (stomatin/prohibitin superfamily)